MARLVRSESTAVTRKRLLHSALETFQRIGFTKATIDGIADDAGYTRGAFYAHFQSKEDVFLEGLSALADEVTPILIARIETCSTAEQAIQTVADWAEQRSQSYCSPSNWKDLYQPGFYR